MNYELSAAQRVALDEMIARRMETTGETKQEAADHISAYIRKGLK